MLAACLVARAQILYYLPNNLWPNPNFESGTNLDDATNGAPLHWNRGGSDPAVCEIITNNYVSPTHSLAVIDNTPNGYGEWYSDLIGLGYIKPGGTINLHWYEMYANDVDQMRMHATWFDAAGNYLGIDDNFEVVSGSSPGWNADIASSTFTERAKTLVVPVQAAQLRLLLTSGGSPQNTGVMVIDDVSAARAPTPLLLSGNFWTNSSFEIGTNLGNPLLAVPSGNWQRGGEASIDQCLTNNYVSATHALAVVDGETTNYGSWYTWPPMPLPVSVAPGTTLSLQWFELYSVTNGQMRVTFSFYDASTNHLTDVSYTVSGNSPAWHGNVSNSGFTQVQQSLVVPARASQFIVQLVSGGPSGTTGIMLIDDLSIAPPPPPPPLLSGNFWPNPTFAGTNGVPTGWIANGTDLNIPQVTTNNYVAPPQALAVIDMNTNGYGEWDSDLVLGTNANPGDTIEVQWYQLYAVTNGSMRVSVLFFDANSNLLTQADATATGNSLGWQGQISGSTFNLYNEQILVPHQAVRLRISLVSGGSPATTGVYLLDELSVAKVVYPSSILSYNFFPNPTFENGPQLDNPGLAVPSGGWQHGGSATSIDEVLTNNYVSPTHSLALVDNDPLNYGEWYLLFNTAGFIGDNDAVDIQWYELYSVTNGSMRLSFAFLDTNSATLFSTDFNVSGQSPGWAGAMAPPSTFTQQFQRLAVPPGTTQLRVNFASGGASTVTGVMLIDDLSVRQSLPLITGITPQSAGYNISWNCMASKLYTLEFATSLAPPVVWLPVATNLPGAALTNSYLDTAVRSGGTGFYRIVQQ